MLFQTVTMDKDTIKERRAIRKQLQTMRAETVRNLNWLNSRRNIEKLKKWSFCVGTIDFMKKNYLDQ